MSKKDDFFVGYAAKIPTTDRRFFLAAGAALMAGTVAGAGMLAANQRGGGTGTWNMGDVREFTGFAIDTPYAMLATADNDGKVKIVPLSCLGKCGVAARIQSYSGAPVKIKGSVIQRGRHAMIAVVDGTDWISPIENLSEVTAPDKIWLSPPEFVTDVSLSGEILDSKCWFGAMRPSEGKVHKACAALCIRGGLPPAFFVKDKAGKNALMIMTNNGDAHGEDLLPYVADPVRITGELLRFGDLLLLDAPVANISRI